MLHIVLAVKDNAGAAIQWAIGAAFALAVGLPFVIWPRKSGELWRKAQQSFTPWRIAPVPVFGSIAVGCLFLLIAVAFFSAALATLMK